MRKIFDAFLIFLLIFLRRNFMNLRWEILNWICFMEVEWKLETKEMEDFIDKLIKFFKDNIWRTLNFWRNISPECRLNTRRPFKAFIAVSKHPCNIKAKFDKNALIVVFCGHRKLNLILFTGIASQVERFKIIRKLSFGVEVCSAKHLYELQISSNNFIRAFFLKRELLLSVVVLLPRR